MSTKILSLKEACASGFKYGLIGHPINQSLSPTLFNSKFGDGYAAIDLDGEDIVAALAQLHSAGFLGLNVTAPYKGAVCYVTNRNTGRSKVTLSCSTLVSVSGGWQAYDLDGISLLLIMKKHNPNLLREPVLVVGTGSAAASIVEALVSRGNRHVFVVGRNMDDAGVICRYMNRKACSDSLMKLFRRGHASSDWGYGKTIKAIINATPVGWNPEDTFPYDVLTSGAEVVFDLTYPMVPNFLARSCRQHGIPYHDGAEMVAEVARCSWKLWGLTDSKDE